MRFFCFLLFLHIFLFHCVLSDAQSGSSIGPSPDAAALVQSINTPVDLSTGTANIQIPLVSIGNISASLHFQSSGIKVQDLATTTGLGWRLSAGGKITRIVCKTPDETGYSRTGSLSQTDGLIASTLSTWTVATSKERSEGEFDSEPDLFFFEIPGRSGMFIIDYNNNAYTVPYQPIDIQWISKNHFVLTDEYGTRYSFGLTSNSRETTRSVQYYLEGQDLKTKNQTFVSTWHLDAIEPLNGKEVTFTYLNGPSLTYTFYNEMTKVRLRSISNTNNIYIENETVYPVRTEITIDTPRYISAILNTPEKVKFQYGTNNTGIFGSWNLTQVIHENRTTALYKNLYYTTFDRGGEKTARLSRITEGKNNESPLFRMEYNPLCLPARNSADFDHWGYYNGKNNSTNRVTFRESGHLFPGADRSVDLSHTQACMLKRIYVSADGYHEYEYEQHGNAGEIGGLRIKSVAHFASSESPGMRTEYRYKKRNENGNWGEGSCETLHPDRYGYYRGTFPTSAKYVDLIFSSSTGTPLFDQNGTNARYGSVGVIHPNGSFEVNEYTSYLSDRCGDEPSLEYTVSLWNYPNPNTWTAYSNTSRFWKRGLLLNRKVWSASRILEEETINTYNIHPEIKRTVKGYQIGHNGTNYLLYEYKWDSQPVFLDQVTTKKRDAPVQQEQYQYHPAYLVPTVITWRADGPHTNIRKTITYPFNYNTSGTTKQQSAAYAIEFMRTRHALNVPIETIETKQGFITKGDIQEYLVLSDGTASPSLVKKREWHLEGCLHTPGVDYIPYSASTEGDHLNVYDPHCTFKKENLSFDEFGNILCSATSTGDTESTVYDRTGQYPLCVIEGAVYNPSMNSRANEVFYTSFEEGDGISFIRAKSGNYTGKTVFTIPLGNFIPGNYQLSWWEWSHDNTTGKDYWKRQHRLLTVTETTNSHTIQASGHIDEIRVHPPGARMITYTYVPGIGKSSETDADGSTTYYFYDSFGRLSEVLDNDRNSLKKYEYYLKNF